MREAATPPPAARSSRCSPQTVAELHAGCQPRKLTKEIASHFGVSALWSSAAPEGDHRLAGDSAPAW
jgi:hypothetical protein